MRAKQIYEAVNFNRGMDPKRSMEIGLSPERIFKEIKPGDIFRLIKSIKDFGYRAGLYVGVVTVESEGYNKVRVYAHTAYSLKELKEKMISNGKFYNWGTPWGWPFDFFKEYLEKVGTANLKESVNFERGKDPKTSMNIGLSPERRFIDLKVGDILELKVDLPQLGYSKGSLVEIIEIIEDDRPNKLRFNFKLYEDGLLLVRSREWSMSLEFFDESFKKTKKTVMEAQNFERGRDPMDSMDIGLTPERRFLNIKAGDVYELKESLPFLAFPKGMFIKIIKILEDNRPNGNLEIEYSVSDPNVIHARTWKLTCELFDKHFKKTNDIVNIKETQNFERGRDPMDSMDIGIKSKVTLKIVSATRDPDPATSFKRVSLSSNEIIEILKNPFKYIKEKIWFDADAYNSIGGEWMGGAFSIAFLLRSGDHYDIRHPHVHDYAEFMGKIYPLNPIGQTKPIVSESIGFERGRDPKEAMKVGLAGSRGLVIKWPYIKILNGKGAQLHIQDIIGIMNWWFRYKHEEIIFEFPVRKNLFTDNKPKFVRGSHSTDHYDPISYDEILSIFLKLVDDPEFYKWVSSPSNVNLFPWDLDYFRVQD